MQCIPKFKFCCKVLRRFCHDEAEGSHCLDRKSVAEVGRELGALGKWSCSVGGYSLARWSAWPAGRGALPHGGGAGVVARGHGGAVGWG